MIQFLDSDEPSAGGDGPGPARARPPAPRVMVAGPVRLHRESVAAGLGTAAQVVAVTGDADATMLAAARCVPDVVVLDMFMAGAMGLVHALADAVPATRVVAFALDDARDDEVLACVEAGVAGWVGRDAGAAEMVDAVLRAARDELVVSARTAALLSRRLGALARERRAPEPAPAEPPAPQLTPRQAEIARLLSSGLTNKHIARALGLRLATVKNHVHNILERLDVRSRGEAGARLRALLHPNGAPPPAPAAQLARTSRRALG